MSRTLTSSDRASLIRLASSTLGSGKNKYLCTYKRKKVEVLADTQLEARDLAAKHFQARKPYDVEAYLVELAGKPYAQTTMFASDRSSLIRLASTLPVGSAERKAILAGLAKTAAVKPADLEALKKASTHQTASGVGPKGPLKVDIRGHLGGRGIEPDELFKGTINVSQAKELHEALQVMFEFRESNFNERIEEIEEQIRELGYEKEEILLDPLYRRALAINKKWGLPLDKKYDNASVTGKDSLGQSWTYYDGRWEKDDFLFFRSSSERKAILAGLSQTAAVKPADLEALKKVEAEQGMDPKTIGLSVSKIVALEKKGLVHYDRGDGMVLLTNEGRKHLKTASVKAQEPYQEVKGVPNSGSFGTDRLKVTNERGLRQLSALLDKIFARTNSGREKPVLTPSEVNNLKKWGVNPATLVGNYGNYMVFVTDATGTTYEAIEDLGIGN